MKPILVVSITISGYSFLSALEEAKTYNGTVSDGGPLGGADRTWLCTANMSQPSGVGNTYDITYEFTYDRDTWDGVFSFEDKFGNNYLNKDGDKATVKRKVLPEAAFPWGTLP